MACWARLRLGRVLSYSARGPASVGAAALELAARWTFGSQVRRIRCGRGSERRYHRQLIAERRRGPHLVHFWPSRAQKRSLRTADGAVETRAMAKSGRRLDPQACYHPAFQQSGRPQWRTSRCLRHQSRALLHPHRHQFARSLQACSSSLLSSSCGLKGSRTRSGTSSAWPCQLCLLERVNHFLKCDALSRHWCNFQNSAWNSG